MLMKDLELVREFGVVLQQNEGVVAHVDEALKALLANIVRHIVVNGQSRGNCHWLPPFEACQIVADAKSQIY